MVAGGDPGGYIPLAASPSVERAMLGACAGSATRFVFIEPGSWWRERNEAEQIVLQVIDSNLRGATMAKPYITDFAAAAIVGPDTSGLNSYNGTPTEVIILGNNMAQGLAVNAVATSTLKWSGTMGNYDTVQQGWPATLTCSNTTTGMGDTLDIYVTVGSGEDISDTIKFTLAVASVAPIGRA